MKKLNVVKQTVSKKIMTRPANNGCGKDSFVSHAIIKRDFGGSTRDVTGKIAPFKMVIVSNLKELLQIENGLLKKEKKRMVPLVYLIYLLKIYVKIKGMFFGFTCPLNNSACHEACGDAKTENWRTTKLFLKHVS